IEFRTLSAYYAMQRTDFSWLDRFFYTPELGHCGRLQLVCLCKCTSKDYEIETCFWRISTHAARMLLFATMPCNLVEYYKVHTNRAWLYQQFNVLAIVAELTLVLYPLRKSVGTGLDAYLLAKILWLLFPPLFLERAR